MKPYIEAKTIEETKTFIQEQQFAFLYISRENCSVCHAVLPQVRELLESFPDIQLMKVDADSVPAVAGEFSVFTVPALLFFVEGKEMYRAARFVVMAELEYQLNKITETFRRAEHE